MGDDPVSIDITKGLNVDKVENNNYNTVGDIQNHVTNALITYTNKRESISPTGVIIRFAPYLLLLLVIWILFFKLIGIAHVPTDDMYPRVDAGDLMLFYRLDRNIRAQDVVYLRKTAPDSGTAENYVSRVVAVAGDTVEINDNGQVVINGSTMVENNIFYRTRPYEDFHGVPADARGRTILRARRQSGRRRGQPLFRGGRSGGDHRNRDYDYQKK